jgi:hypothetical protein
VDHPRGSIANPMTPEEMHKKVHMLADDVIGSSAAAALIEVVANVTMLPRVDQLTRLCHPESAEEAEKSRAAHV